MTTTPEDIREQLLAVIEAAPELARESRQQLADVFLDELQARYDLVPRRAGKKPSPARPAGAPFWSARWVPFALLLALLVFVTPAMIHHRVPIVLLLGVGVFLLVRRAILGPRRGRPSWR